MRSPEALRPVATSCTEGTVAGGRSGRDSKKRPLESREEEATLVIAMVRIRVNILDQRRPFDRSYIAQRSNSYGKGGCLLILSALCSDLSRARLAYNERPENST